MGLRQTVAEWFAIRWAKDGLAGKKGALVKKALGAVVGVRSAVMALLLLGELVAKQMGLESGPLFGVLRAVLGSLGATEEGGKALLGADPAVILAAAMTLWVTGARFIAHLKTLKNAPKA